MSAPRVILSKDATAVTVGAAHLREAFGHRHVPLPGALANLLEKFLNSRQPLLDPFWGQAFGCMAKSLNVSGAVGGQSLMVNARQRFALVVAEPVLRNAAKRIGQMPLVGHGTSEADIPGFAAAAAALQQATTDALTDPEVMGKPFWVHVALDLLHEAIQSTRTKARLIAPQSLGRECDPALAALVFLHPPSFDVTRQLERPRRKANRVSAHRRAGIRPKEGGVAGIRQSRSLEDLPDGLFSEMIQPRMLLANKLLHEGLLVRHRPPRRDPRRDLLAVSMQMADRDDGTGLLVKAAWADAAIRLRLALSQMGLTNSDMIWAQDGCDAALLDCQISEPGLGRLPPFAIEGRVRADMLMRSTLFPTFAVVPARTPAPAAGAEPESRHTAMLRLWRSGLAPLAARHRRDPAGLPMDYGQRMVMLCRPMPRQADWGELRAQMSTALGREIGGKSHLACLTWRADAAGDPPEVLGFSDGGRDVQLTPPRVSDERRDEALAEFMGALVGWMIDVTLEALDVDQA